ncbi:hypothetical protein [Kocuria sp.]|uniref:hypothetical protein n=1 Tax=Kocuria sp. TaxID=1871328 RepID=UPI0026DD09DF|nr:hypothetical protein [Kocuria sp.]MDO4918738.1 hypothetical protein [Kocuria sp.]
MANPTSSSDPENSKKNAGWNVLIIVLSAILLIEAGAVAHTFLEERRLERRVAELGAAPSCLVFEDQQSGRTTQVLL